MVNKIILSCILNNPQKCNFKLRPRHWHLMPGHAATAGRSWTCQLNRGLFKNAKTNTLC